MTTETLLNRKHYFRIKTYRLLYNPRHHKTEAGINPNNVNTLYAVYGFASDYEATNHKDIFGPEYVDLRVDKPDVEYREDYGLDGNAIAVLLDKDNYSKAESWRYQPEDRDQEMLALCDKIHFNRKDELELTDKLFKCSHAISLNANTIAAELEKVMKLDTFAKASESSLSVISQARTEINNTSRILSLSQEKSSKELAFEKILHLIIQRDGYFPRRKLNYHNARKYVLITGAVVDEIFDRNIPLPEKDKILNKVVELLISDRELERSQWDARCHFTANTTARNFKKNDEVWDYAYITERVNHAAALLVPAPQSSPTEEPD